MHSWNRFNINIKKIMFKHPDRKSKLHIKKNISGWCQISPLYLLDIEKKLSKVHRILRGKVVIQDFIPSFYDFFRSK